MFKWDDARVVVALCRDGSMAAASKSLSMDTSTVSRRLAALETALGGRLFDRTPEGLLPTSLGTKLRPYVEEMEAAALAFETEAAGQDARPEGVVRVAVPDAFAVYVLAPALPAFLDANPGISVDVLASTDLVDLTRREADVALRFVRPTKGDLVCQKIASSGGYAGFVSVDYAANHDDLSEDKVDWIGWSESKSHLPEAQLFRELVGRVPRLTADNLVVQIEAARSGAGALLMPTAFGDLRDVVRLAHWETTDIDVDVFVVTHRALRRVPRVRLVMDWLSEIVVAGGGRA